MRAHVLSFHYYRLGLVALFSEIRLCLRLRDGDENRKHYPTYINVGLSFRNWCVSDVSNQLILIYNMWVLFPYHLKNMLSNCHIFYLNLQF